MVNLKDIELYILDMDGTIYLGRDLIKGAKDFIKHLDKVNKKYIFLTNNSSKNADDYQKKLKNLGIEAKRKEIVTSGEVTAYYLKNKYGLKDKNIYVVGTNSLKKEFEKLGFNIVGDKEERVDCVVLGFDTTLTYHKLWDAHDLIREGCDYIATNPDLICPLEEGKSMPDCGSIAKLLEASAGQLPFVVGKPNRLMVDYISDRYKIDKDRIAMVGDRLYTDMKMAKDANIIAILVLSGETKKEDLDGNKALKPDFVMSDIEELLKEIRS
ncbi:MAG: HAD-IIA family hydrolase [Halanaerobiales bacterium]